MIKMRLSRFTAHGFRNFKNPVTIDFTAVRDYKFNTECIDGGIITKMGIYGTNGVGKSNLGIALFDIVSLLTDKFVSPEFLTKDNFLNLDKKFEFATFTYEFIDDGKTYIFEYRKNFEAVLMKEKLTVDGNVIYDYDYKARKFLSLERNGIIDISLNFDYLSGGLSVLRYIANNSVQKKGSPILAIMDFVSHMLLFRSVHQNGFIGLEDSVTTLDDWIIKNGLTGDFNRFLNDVCDVNIKLDSARLPDDRHVLVEKHNNGALLFSRVYSSGIASVELFYFWMKKFSDVTLVYADEFDAYYHFEMALNIINKLKGFNNVQAIFTTHNIALMSNSILRPDCYLIFNGDGDLKPYIDLAGGREIREGHNLEKIYKNGGLDVRT